MILQLVRNKEFKKMSNGVSKFVSYKNNGRLYILKMKRQRIYKIFFQCMDYNNKTQN